jgi:hypothetical protein
MSDMGESPNKLSPTEFFQNSKWIAEHIRHLELDLEDLRERRKVLNDELKAWRRKLEALAIFGLKADVQIPITFKAPAETEEAAKSDAPQPEEAATDATPERAPEQTTVEMTEKVRCEVCGKEYTYMQALDLDPAQIVFDGYKIKKLVCSESCMEKASKEKRR